VLDGGACGFDALRAAAYTSGLGPLLGHWLERGDVAADAACRSLFARHLDHGRRRASRLTASGAALLEALAARGVEPTVLKGLHTREYFPEPGTRPCADIDVLVPERDLAAAQSVLRKLGYVETLRTARPFRSEWAEAGAASLPHSLELDHVEDPLGVDLHVGLERMYFRGVWARLTPALPAHRTRAMVAGHEVTLLAQPLLLAFLAIHAGHLLDTLRAVRLVELAFVMRRDAAGAPLWAPLVDLLGRTGTGRFAWPALELTGRLAPGSVDPEVLERLRREVTPRMRRVVATMTDGLRLPRRSLDEKLMWARGPGELLLNLSELVWSADSRATPREVLRLYRRRWHMLRRRALGVRAAG
jgi:hypothetical protein